MAVGVAQALWQESPGEQHLMHQAGSCSLTLKPQVTAMGALCNSKVVSPHIPRNTAAGLQEGRR